MFWMYNHAICPATLLGLMFIIFSHGIGELYMAAALDDSIDLSLMEPVFDEFEGREGALIPILERAQEIYGYLSLPI